MGLVWHDPTWEPAELPIDAEGNTRPGIVCVHELENGNGQCGGNVFHLDQAVGRHCCHVGEEARPMATPDGMVLVPRWAVRALVGPATIQEQGRARQALKTALADKPDTEEA